MLQKLALLLLALVLSGCSTTPITKETGNQVPQDRIYPEYLEMIKDKEDLSTLTIFRDKGFVGAACEHDFFINGVKAFTINDKEFIDLKLPPSDYFFRIDTGKALCTNVSLSLETVLRKNELREYRISISAAGQIGFSRAK